MLFKVRPDVLDGVQLRGVGRLDGGGLYYRGPAPAVDLLLPEIEAHREDIAAELRRRTHAPVISGRLRLKP